MFFKHSFCAFICLTNNSLIFLNEYQPKLYQHFSHVCPTYHTIFSLKKTLECTSERLLVTQQADSCHKLDPQQMICISLQIHNLFFTVAPLGFLRTMFCSFWKGHRVPCSTGGRNLPIYTAGWTGAMRVKFLAQGNNNNNN